MQSSLLLILMLHGATLTCAQESKDATVNDAFGKTIKFGACPKATPMSNFDVTQAYGKWYLAAWIGGETLVTPQKCIAITLQDANQGSDICRVDYNRDSKHNDEDEVTSQTFASLLIDPSSPAQWVLDFHTNPVSLTYLDTDYQNYLLMHQCGQFPRDNPVVFEQHVFVLSRTPDASTDTAKLEKFYARLDEILGDGFSDLMTTVDQEGCD